MGRLEEPLMTRRMGMDTEEAAKALFSLKASPIITPQRSMLHAKFQLGANGTNSMALPGSSLGPNAMMPVNGTPPKSLSFSMRQAPPQSNNSSDPTAAAGTLCALMQSSSPSPTAQRKSFGRLHSASLGSYSPSHMTYHPDDPLSHAAQLSQLMNHTGPVTRPRTDSTLSIDIRLSNATLNSPDYDDGDNDSVSTEPAFSTDRHRKIGQFSPTSRRKLIDRFIQKRRNRIWKKRIKYDVRKHFADSRLRVKGRFVRKEDEEQLRDFLMMT